MSLPEQQLRGLVADYSRRLHARGWVANHDGNISVRLLGGRFLCTPGATSKAAVTQLARVAARRPGGSGDGTVWDITEGLRLVCPLVLVKRQSGW